MRVFSAPPIIPLNTEIFGQPTLLWCILLKMRMQKFFCWWFLKKINTKSSICQTWNNCSCALLQTDINNHALLKTHWMLFGGYQEMPGVCQITT